MAPAAARCLRTGPYVAWHRPFIRTVGEPQLTYLDVEKPMLGADGKPRPELFVQDGLHMTPEGYKIWNAAMRPLLEIK